jgi:hypothetical protein
VHSLHHVYHSHTEFDLHYFTMSFPKRQLPPFREIM